MMAIFRIESKIVRGNESFSQKKAPMDIEAFKNNRCITQFLGQAWHRQLLQSRQCSLLLRN